MRVVSLASGSSGNAMVIQHRDTALLLDAGLPIRALHTALAALGITDDALTAILLSHEHHDHVCGLVHLLRYQHVPVICTAGTLRALDPGPGFQHEVISPGRAYELGGLVVLPVEVSHDALEPVGFVVSDGEAAVAVFTDLGTVDQHVYEALRTAHLVVLEANYDTELLERGSYPWPLKQRIRSPRGHLSNEECALTLARLDLWLGREVWLAHLSAENNTPRRALETVRQTIGIRHERVPIRTLPRRGSPVAWDSRAPVTGTDQLRLL